MKVLDFFISGLVPYECLVINQRVLSTFLSFAEANVHTHPLSFFFLVLIYHFLENCVGITKKQNKTPSDKNFLESDYSKQGIFLQRK